MPQSHIFSRGYKKKGKLGTSHRYDLLPLLPSDPGGIQRELVVYDFPRLQIYYFSLKLSKMNGRMSSTFSNFHAFFVPYMMTLIGRPDRVWYSAIT